MFTIVLTTCGLFSGNNCCSASHWLTVRRKNEIIFKSILAAGILSNMAATPPRNPRFHELLICSATMSEILDNSLMASGSGKRVLIKDNSIVIAALKPKNWKRSPCMKDGGKFELPLKKLK